MPASIHWSRSRPAPLDRTQRLGARSRGPTPPPRGDRSAFPGGMRLPALVFARTVRGGRVPHHHQKLGRLTLAFYTVDLWVSGGGRWISILRCLHGKPPVNCLSFPLPFHVAGRTAERVSAALPWGRNPVAAIQPLSTPSCSARGTRRALLAAQQKPLLILSPVAPIPTGFLMRICNGSVVT